jgi:hypothetical protein
MQQEEALARIDKLLGELVDETYRLHGRQVGLEVIVGGALSGMQIEGALPPRYISALELAAHQFRAAKDQRSATAALEVIERTLNVLKGRPAPVSPGPKFTVYQGGRAGEDPA